MEKLTSKTRKTDVAVELFLLVSVSAVAVTVTVAASEVAVVVVVLFQCVDVHVSAVFSQGQGTRLCVGAN